MIKYDQIELLLYPYAENEILGFGVHLESNQILTKPPNLQMIKYLHNMSKYDHIPSIIIQ